MVGDLAGDFGPEFARCFGGDFTRTLGGGLVSTLVGDFGGDPLGAPLVSVDLKLAEALKA